MTTAAVAGLSLEEIRRITDGAWATVPQPQRRITVLSTDTRTRLPHPEATLFLGLKGSRRSGGQFLNQALQQGIRNFLLDALPEVPLPDGAAVLLVPDALYALQELAAEKRRRFPGTVVAITGSNGKTVVKEWLYELLAEDQAVIRSPRSYNSQIGVPLSVWLLSDQYQTGLFEAGISEPGEMARLAHILRPDLGIFTNIGDAHDRGFAGHAAKALEKARLFRQARKVVYCADYPEVEAALEDCARQPEGPELISWSATGRKACWQVLDLVAHTAAETTFTLLSKDGERHHLRIPFADKAALENAVHCWLAARELGIADGFLAPRLARLHPVAMRLELRKGIHGCTLLNDTYNSDPTSLQVALDMLQQQRQHLRHSVVLSDMEQNARQPEELYDALAAMIAASGVQRFVGVGPQLTRYARLFEARLPEVHFFPDTAAFRKALPELHFHDEALLIKGARSFSFERIVALLEQEVHRTVLTLDLEALRQNLKVDRQLLPPQVKLMAMVKAFSYGSGSHEIAHALQNAGVDYLTVAYTDEGVALREKGITLPIMVMSPDIGSFERLIAWKLEPEIFSFRSLQAFSEAAEALSAAHYPVHIKLNTGMNRLGFDTEDIPRLGALLATHAHARVRSVFSHLAGSEDACLDELTAGQAALFRQNSEALMAYLPGTPPLRHLCNSAGISRHPDLYFDMVRLGLGLYGIDASARRLPVQGISTLRTTIAQLRTVPAGKSVSYGGRGVSAQARRIATVCIGYADGYPRALGHGVGFMTVHGREAPVVGAVCMDLCMLDVTHIPEAAEGDEVVVFGSHPTLNELAAWSGTIPYEIMTGISQRVKRIYLNEG